MEQSQLKQFLENRIANLLQTWQAMADDRPLDYQRETGNNIPLLNSAGRKTANMLSKEEELFKIQWSLREVEPKVNLFLRYPPGYGKEDK